MPREYNITWSRNQRAKLNSAVRKYNNAVRKAARNNPLLTEYLPKEVSYQDIKASITTARALKNKVNSLNRVTSPNALQFVKQDDASITTKYARKEFSILRSVRERRKSMRSKKESVSGNRIGTLAQAESTPDKRKIGSFSSKSLSRFIETQEKEINKSSAEKARRYFSNYTSALRNVFGGFAEYDKDVSMIEDKIISLANRSFNALEDAIDESPSITYIYDPIARASKMTRLVEYWAEL